LLSVDPEGGTTIERLGSSKGLVAIAALLGTLSVVFAGVAILLHEVAQARFDEEFRLLALDVRLVQSQNIHRRLRWELGKFQRELPVESVAFEESAEACELGLWLESPARVTAEGELQELGALFKNLEVSHRAFHDSAQRITARLAAQDRVGARDDLTQYADPAMVALAGDLERIQETIEGERRLRGESLRRQESVGVVMIGGIALLAVLGSLGAMVTVLSHRRSTVALHRAVDALEKLIADVPFGVVVVDEGGGIRRANKVAGEVLKSEPAALVGLRWGQFARVAPSTGPEPSHEAVIVDSKGSNIPVLLAAVPTELDGGAVHINAFVDLSERRRLETQLRHSQKLEAVGQLASGIAHEINTPSQYVGDSLSYLSDSYHDVLVLIATYRTLISKTPEPLREEAKLAEDDADLEYLVNHTPSALQRAKEGMARITTIVRAMKEFAHPGGVNKQLADLNKALEMTLIIARNEYKYVADVETKLGQVPTVLCHVDDLNQVFLNLLVNAAHAIADRAGPNGPKGRITVRTAHEGQAVRVEVEDSGCGIPEAIRDRVFEPFFTTKEVGRGTGQGLAIARSIVVEKHGGSLTFESEVGRGTTFIIRLPIDGTRLEPTSPGPNREAA